MSIATAFIKPFIRNNKRLVVASIITGLGSSVCSLLLTLTIGKYFDDAFSYTTNKGRILSLLGLHLDKSLFHLFEIFAVLILAKLITGWGEVYFTALSGEGLGKMLRERLFETQLHQEYDRFKQKETGKYLLRYSGDMRSIQNMLTKGMLGFIKDMLFVLTGIYFLLLLHPALAATFLLFALSLLLLTMALDSKLAKTVAGKRDLQSSLFSFVAVRLLSLQSVKVFNKEPIEIGRFNKRSAINFETARQYHFINSFIQSSAPVILYASLIVTLWASGLYTSPVKGNILLNYVLITILLFPSLRKIIKVRTVWQSGNISAKKLQEVFDIPAEYANKDKLRGDIKSIAFNASTQDLREHKLPGQYMESMSCGKLYFLNHERGDALIQLITGISPSIPESVFINGADIHRFSKKSIRRKIAVSAEFFPLYGRTVYEAATYAKTNENRERLQLLLQMLHFSALATIDVDNPIGIYGNLLPPDQKKILLHARALLTGKRVLIFEEPFSGLNMLQAQSLQKILQEKSADHIVIITGEEQGLLKKPNAINKAPVLN